MELITCEILLLTGIVISYLLTCDFVLYIPAIGYNFKVLVLISESDSIMCYAAPVYSVQTM